MEHDCQNRLLLSAVGLSAIHPLWELSGKTLSSLNIFMSRSSTNRSSTSTSRSQASPHTRAGESPFIRVAEAQPATACPTIILLPSYLFLNCFLRLHIFPFRQFPFRHVASHRAGISKFRDVPHLYQIRYFFNSTCPPIVDVTSIVLSKASLCAGPYPR